MNNYNIHSSISQALHKRNPQQIMRAHRRKQWRQYFHVSKLGRLPDHIVKFLMYAPRKSANRLIEFMIRRRCLNKRTFPSVKKLSKYLKISYHSVVRMVNQLADLGILRKISEYGRFSKELELNPIFFRPAIRQRLSKLFPTFERLARNYLLLTCGFSIELMMSQSPASNQLSRKNVNYNIFKEEVSKKYNSSISTYNRKRDGMLHISQSLEQLTIEDLPDGHASACAIAKAMPEPAVSHSQIYSSNRKVDESLNKQASNFDDRRSKFLESLSAFGKIKMDIAPEIIRNGVIADHIREGKPLSFTQILDEALNRCTAQGIKVAQRWAKFFEICKEKGWDPKKEAPVKMGPKKNQADDHFASRVNHDKQFEEELASGLNEQVKNERIAWLMNGPLARVVVPDFLKDR